MSKYRQTIEREVTKRICIGNTDRGTKHLASDLLHAIGEAPSKIAIGTGLSEHTVRRVLDCDEHYGPKADTTDRVMRYCNVQLVAEECKIKPKYVNKPKDLV